VPYFIQFKDAQAAGPTFDLVPCDTAEEAEQRAQQEYPGRAYVIIEFNGLDPTVSATREDSD
jgi:hypothetical protein